MRVSSFLSMPRGWIVGLLSVILAIFSGYIHAETATDQTASPKASKTEIALNSLNAEIQDLSEQLKVTTGDQKDAIQFRLFNKNNDLREVIGKAIDEGSLPKEALIEQVRVQQQYTVAAKQYLEKKNDEVSKEFNAAKEENKLTILNSYSELQDYLNTTYNASWQNLEWFEKLGVQDKKAEDEFEGLVGNKLRLTSASIEYFGQQATAVGSQIASAPEADKAGLQTVRELTGA